MTTDNQVTAHEVVDGVTAHIDTTGKVLGVVLAPGSSVKTNLTDGGMVVEIMHIPWFDEDTEGRVSVVADQPTEIDGGDLTDAIDRFCEMRDNPAYAGVVLFYEGKGYLLREIVEARS